MRSVLSHQAADAAVNIAPTLKDKVDIIQNAIDLGRMIGIEQPRVAILSTGNEIKQYADDVADKYDVPLVKLTGGQRIDLLGIKKDDLPKVWADLGMPSGYAYTKALRTVR